MELDINIGLASTVIAVAAGAYFIFFGLVRNFNEWYFCSGKKKFKNPLPPGDLGWPVFGNMNTYLHAYKMQDPDAYTFDLVKRYGETGVYRAHLFGKPHAVVITPETSKTVLVDEEKFKLGYPSLIELAGRKSLLCIAGNEHKRLRKLAMSPINGFEPLSLYIGLIEEAVTVNLEKWANKDKPVELIHELVGNTFRVITNIFFGPGGHEKFGHMRSLFTDLTNGLYVVGINLPGFAYRKAFKARRKIVSIVDGAIEERRKMNKNDESKENSSMLDFLLEVEDEDGDKLDNESIIDLLAGIVFAGHESSAFATMWVLLYLRQNPQVAQKVKEEQEEIVKNRPPTQKGLSMKEIKQMNYTVKVVNETLRMANLGFGVFREATEDAEISGYFIPKGWKILVMQRHVHMDPQVHPNPKTFDPSRFDNPNAKAGTFFPFGLGVRTCPGVDLARLQIYIFIHYFYLNYKIEVINPDCQINYFPIPLPKDNCLAKIIKLS